MQRHNTVWKYCPTVKCVSLLDTEKVAQNDVMSCHTKVVYTNVTEKKCLVRWASRDSLDRKH